MNEKTLKQKLFERKSPRKVCYADVRKRTVACRAAGGDTLIKFKRCIAPMIYSTLLSPMSTRYCTSFKFYFHPLNMIFWDRNFFRLQDSANLTPEQDFNNSKYWHNWGDQVNIYHRSGLILHPCTASTSGSSADEITFSDQRKKCELIVSTQQLLPLNWEFEFN